MRCARERIVIVVSFSCNAVAVFQVGGTADEVVEFVVSKSVPLVGQRTKLNQASKYAGRPLVVVYYDVNFDHQYVRDTQLVRDKVLQVAGDYLKVAAAEEASLRFAVANEDEYAEELQTLDLADALEDVKVAAFGANSVKFRMDPVDDFTAQDLRRFVDRIVAGKVRPFVRSQPVPRRQTGAVRVVVANSFADQVLSSDKDVLLEFYAPW